MADPIMDLFDDPNLFGLDSLTDESFNQGAPDPIEEALGLPGGALDSLAGGAKEQQAPPQPEAPPPQTLPLSDAQPGAAPELPPQDQPGLLQAPQDQEVLSQGNPFMGVSSTAAAQAAAPSSSTGGQQQVVAAAPPPAPKIVILKAPAGGSMAGAHVAQIQAQPIGAANGGKVTFAKVLTGTPLRPGVSIVSGNAVLATKVSPGAGAPATLHRLVQPGRPVKQLVLQPVKSQGGGNTGAAPLKPAVTLTSTPAQVSGKGRPGPGVARSPDLGRG